MSWLQQPDGPGDWLLKNERDEVLVVRVSNALSGRLIAGMVEVEDYFNHTWHRVIVPPKWDLVEAVQEVCDSGGRFDCKGCRQQGIGVDEDGCCKTCGGDAVAVYSFLATDAVPRIETVINRWLTGEPKP